MNTHMRAALAPIVALLPIALGACSDDATAPEGFATEELTATLTVAPDHFHIWETVGTFAVSVTDPDGAAVTDFDLLRVERRLTGATSWSSINLALEGDAYSATYTFETSGAYELRVAGLRPQDEEAVVLHTAETPLEVIRPHPTVGGYRVEFETFPGHIHAGDTASVAFFVFQAARNAEGVRPPVPGLAPTISVEIGGVRSTYPAREAQPGVYVATHRFTTVGTTGVGIRLIGTTGQEAQATIPIVVHAPH